VNKKKQILLPKFNLIKLSFGLFLLLYSCNINDSTENVIISEIKFVKEYDLAILEPSGLTFNKDYSALYTVSDNTNRIYKLSLEGKIQAELNYVGNDLEGVVFEVLTNTIWVVEERLREVVNIDLSGAELVRKKINISGSDNKGLEGICFDTTGTMYLINEKNPKLFITLKNNLSIYAKEDIAKVGDLSGITYDNKHKVFWIVSDEAKLLFKWKPNDGIIKSFNLSFAKAEGVAYNLIQNRIYIVSDKTNKLYIYQITEQEE